MADIKLLYPIASDFAKLDEILEPEVFNYFCLHGNQLFIERKRGMYRIITRGWQPPDKYCHAFDNQKLVLNNYFVVDIKSHLRDAELIFGNLALYMLNTMVRFGQLGFVE